MKKWLMGLISLALVTLVACSNNEKTSGDQVTKDNADFVIGVTQIVEHPSLDAALDGFKQAIKDAKLNVYFDVQIAQGDAKNNQTIANKFVGDHVDLIFANSTPSAQSALNATKDIPIIFTSVTDPVGSGLVKSMEEAGSNITGTTDTHPDAIPNTLAFIQDEMGMKDIGMIYNSGEQNSVVQVERVKQLANNEFDIKVHEATVTSSAEVKQAAEALIGKVDGFYIITDNTVVSSLESVLMVGEQEKLPVFVGELDSVKRGGFAAYGFDYYDIGYEAGQKAVKVLKDQVSPSDLPVTYPQKLKLEINRQAADKLGIQMKDSWKDIAEIINDDK